MISDSHSTHVGEKEIECHKIIIKKNYSVVDKH